MIDVILCGLLAACLSILLQYCYQKGNIFRFYYAIVSYYLIYKPRKRYVLTRLHIVNKRYHFYRLISEPLGRCVYCQNVWVTFFTFFIFCPNAPMIYAFWAAGAAHFFIYVLQGIKNYLARF